ncbi:MAG TPA: hypothetical protein VKY74_01095 [Chloroflexia bacterium]|nr:hypothetical protein [Chloroflexia bacterium]
MGELLGKVLELLPEWVGWTLMALVVAGLIAGWIYQARAGSAPPARPAADASAPPRPPPPTPPNPGDSP